MPLPLIPIIIIATSGIAAVEELIRGGINQNEANKINEKAKKILKNSEDELKNAKNKTAEALSSLGKKKIDIYNKHLTHFIKSFEKLKNVELEKSPGLEELAKFKIDKKSFAELKKTAEIVTSIATGAGSGAVAGAVTALGAYSLAGTFASATTGTAIATLHGVAATNATLAFFGGGSIAAGGGGIAAGMWVLGGLVAAPAMAVMGIIMGLKASKNLDNAKTNLVTANEVEEEMKVWISACDGIRKRSDLFTKNLIKLESILHRQLAKFEYIIATEGVDYSKYSDAAQNLVVMLLGTVQAVKALLDTPLLDEKGALTAESEKVINTVKGLLPA